MLFYVFILSFLLHVARNIVSGCDGNFLSWDRITESFLYSFSDVASISKFCNSYFQYCDGVLDRYYV